MKTSLLLIIACAMTVFAQPSSPFTDIANAINDYDAVFGPWQGDLSTMPEIISAENTMNKSIETTCSTPMSLQPDDVQMMWFTDAKNYLDTLNNYVDLSIAKTSTLDSVLPVEGRQFTTGTVKWFKYMNPRCIQTFSNAFDLDKQVALEGVGTSADQILQKGIDAIASSS